MATREHALVAIALGVLSVTLGAQARPFGPREASAVGEALLAAQIARYGRIANPAWDQDISGVLSRLQRATGYAGLQLRFVVVGNTEENAAAVPGNALLVNGGLLRFLQSLAAKTSTSSARHDRFTGLLAAVLSHEIAHITLGHTDSLLATVTQLATTAGIPESALGDPLSYRSAAQDTAVTLEMLEHSRERELAADRVGALYLLRAGWTIQTAMDLFRALDSLERERPTFYESITYVRTHPRASTREAELEAFRARLKLLQADYDDALSLIDHNVAVSTAVTLLDTVLAYFPEMSAALHARGTAYHQLWLETVPVPTQQARASLMTYTFKFLPLIRGVPGNLSLYTAAKQDYSSVLAHDPLALTSVQLALLEAYAGDCVVANQRAREAMVTDSVSPSVVNDGGVVFLVCDKPTDALQAFQRAQRLAGPQPVPTFLFNTARAMKRIGDPRAEDFFRQYLSMDATSEWATEARRELGVPDTGQPARRVAVRANAVPEIQGIRLGDTIDKVRATWGAPSSVSGDTITIMSYAARGVSVAVSPGGGVVVIGLLTRKAGAIDGVRVGDRVAAARAAWGAPVEQRDENLFFNRGTWTVASQTRGVSIAMLAILANE